MSQFNVSPYFDDFDAAKNFYRVLFQPGRPVQTRELNQLQSILQNQVQNFGNHMFKNGAMIIPGQVHFDPGITYLKVQDVHNTIDANVVVPNMVGKTVTDGVREAYVSHAELGVSDDQATLFIRYISGEGEFAADSTVYVVDEPGLAVKTETGVDYTGKGSLVSINEGIYYVNGIFCSVAKQTVAVEKYNQFPTKVVGLDIVESVVNVNTDPSLYDNALGYSNYGAPGADRYKIELVLTVKDFSDEAVSPVKIEFIDLLHIKSGKITMSVDDTAYAEFERLLAKRTFDESGNYLVTPFSFSSFDYRSNNRGAWTASTPYLIGDIVVNSIGEYWVALTRGITSTNSPTSYVSDVPNSVFSFNDGDVLWRYIQSPVYNNGIYTETAATSIEDMDENATKMAYRISAGKGYVYGHQVAKQSESYVVTDKAIKFDYRSNEVMPIYAGNTMVITNVVGIPDINTYETINLYYVKREENWSSLKRQATATVTPTAGAISTSSTIVITDSGFGYDVKNPPTITVGTAVFKCSVAPTGQIESITLTKAGTSGSGSTPISLTISAPPANKVSIGTARVRSFEFVDGVLGSATAKYRLEVFDVKLVDSKYSFNDHVFSLDNGTSFKCDLDTTVEELSGSVTITSSDDEVQGLGTGFASQLKRGQMIRVGNDKFNRVSVNDYSDIVLYGTHNFSASASSQPIYLVKNSFVSTGALMQPLPRSFVRSVRSEDDSTINTSFTTIRRITKTLDTNGDVIVSLSVPGEAFTNTTTPGNYIVAISNSGEEKILNSSEVTVTRTSSTSITINATAPFANKNVEIIAKIEKAGNAAREKQKTLKLATKDIVNVASLSQQTIKLDFADCFRIVKILKSAGAGSITGGNYAAFDLGATQETFAEDITNQYDFFNGQNLFYYDLGSITRGKNVVPPNNAIRVVYEYFEHSSGDYCSINSYSNLSEDVLITFEKDYLDFRPVMLAGGTFKATEAIEYGSDIAFDYSYYLPRQDLIEFKKTGAAVVLNGRSAYSVPCPTPDSDAMAIATAVVAPGKIGINPKTAQITPLGVVRQTMQDISNLARRVENLEYYTQLNLLEKESLDSTVIDENGLDRFKAGIFVDNLKDQINSDINNPDYMCAVDPVRGEARAFAVVNHLNMKEQSVSDAVRKANNYKLTGNTATLPYTHEVFINQPVGNNQNYINPFLVLSFTGTMIIHPKSDTWVDTTFVADNVVHIDNYQKEWDAAQKSGAFGTKWGEWNVNYTATLTDSQTQGRFGADVKNVAVVNTGTLKANALTGSTAANVTFNNGQSATSANWTQSAVQQLYSREGYTVGTALRNKQRSATDNNVGTITNDIYNFTFNGTRTGTETIGQKVTTVTDSGSKVVGTSSLGHTRTRPIFFKIEGCKASDTFKNITFGDRPIPTDSSGDIDGVTIIKIGKTTPLASSISTLLNSVGLTSDKVASEYSSRVISKTKLAKYTNITNTPEIVWDKGSLVSNGAGATAILADVIDQTTYVELICINQTGTFSNGNTITIDGTSYGVTTGIDTSSFPQTKQPKTDSTGRCFGVFYPAANSSTRYSAGKNVLKLENSVDPSSVTSTAEAEYFASGTSQQVQKTVTITDSLAVTTRTVSESQSFNQTVNFREQAVQATNPLTNNSANWGDPVAQTFLIDNSFESGVFVTQVGIFISHIDSKNGLEVQIAETVNGYPSRRILASKMVYASQMTGKFSPTSPIEYVVTFDNPVFLKSAEEYCVILKSPASDKWKTWISVGAQASGADETVGVFFESSNSSTWTPDQLKDLTFRLYRAKFDIKKAGTVTFINSNLTRKSLGNNPLLAKSGSAIVRVEHPEHSFRVGDVVNIVAGTATITGPFSTPSFALSGNFTITHVARDSYLINLGKGNATASGYFGGAAGNITVSDQIDYSTIVPNIDIATFANTDYSMAISNVFYDTGTTDYEREVDFTVFNSDTVELEKTYSVLSRVNEVAQGHASSCQMVVTMTSTKDNLSPVLSIDRGSVLLIKNKLNNPSYADASSFDDVVICTDKNLTYDYNSDKPEASSIYIDAAAYVAAFDQLQLGQYIAVTGTTANTNKAFLINKIEYLDADKIMLGIDARYTVNTSDNSVVGVFTDEDLSAALTSTVTLKSGLLHDITNRNSTTDSNYVTRPMNLQIPSNGVRVTMDVNVPVSANLEVYYRAVMTNEFDLLSDKPWVLINKTLSNTPKASFIETVWEANDIPSYDSIQIKVAMKSTNSAITPKIKNVRMIALA